MSITYDMRTLTSVGNDLAFMVSSKLLFNIPMSKITNSNINNREIAIDLAPSMSNVPEDAPPELKRAAKKAHEVSEIRLYIPGDIEVSDDEDDDKSNASEKDDAPETMAQLFHNELQEKANIQEGLGDPIVTFFNINSAAPRGRFDIEVHDDSIRLRGKTYDYKILMRSIHRLFVLPRSDEVNVQLILGLDPAIRQGQTRYPYLILQFLKDEVMTVTLNITESV